MKTREWFIHGVFYVAILTLICLPYLVPIDTVISQQEEKVIWKWASSYNPPPVGHYNVFASGCIGSWFQTDRLTHYFLSNGTYIPLLAESWTLDPNYMWFVVKLRKGVKFHDGHELTYKDVLASLYPAYLQKDRLWYFIKDVKIIDDYTLNFTFTEKTDYPVFYILWHWHIVSATQYWQFAEKVINLRNQGYNIFVDDKPFQPILEELRAYRPDWIIGCGPFKHKSVTETELVVEKFEDYWAGVPPIDEIHIIRYPSADLEWEALLRGELDFSWKIAPTPELAKQLEEKPWAWTIYISRPIGVLIYINKAKYPLNLVEVRRAIAYAINRSETGFVQYPGGYKVVEYETGWYAPDMTVYINQSFINSYLKEFKYDYNPSKAEDLLKKLGFTKGADGIYVTPNGTKLEFEFVFSPAAYISATAVENIKAQLEKVGIKINPKSVDWSVWYDALCYSKYDLTAAASGSPSFSFDEFYYKYFVLFPGHDPAKTWGQLQYVPWKKDPVNVTALALEIKKYPAEISRARLSEIYAELSYITGDQLPAINLYLPAVQIYMNKKWAFPTDPNYWACYGSYLTSNLQSLFSFFWLRPKFALTIEAAEGGTLSIAPGIYEYAKGETVTLTATPSSGYTFERWELDGSPAGTSTSITIKMDKAHRVRAVFSRIPYELYVGIAVLVIVIIAAAYLFVRKKRK